MHLPFGVWVMDARPITQPRATSPQRPARPLKLPGAESSLLVSAVLLLGAIGMFLLDAGSSLLFFVVAYVFVGAGLQMLTTPINTWGVNSLDNALVQHATAVTNTMNQVGGSLGTALIMSFSAMGMASASQFGGVEQLAAGYRFSFGAVLALAIVVCVLVVLCVRNRKSDKEPVQESHSTVDAEGVATPSLRRWTQSRCPSPPPPTWPKPPGCSLHPAPAAPSSRARTDRSRAFFPTVMC